MTPSEISDTLRTAIRHLTSARRSLCAASGMNRRVEDLRDAATHMLEADYLLTDARLEISELLRLITEKAARKGIFGKKGRKPK
jgi:hypothetical protein